jgi:glycolate oxidase FAD binding subunit
MSTVLTPGSVSELIETVRSTPKILAIGTGTKPRLSAAADLKMSLKRLKGIIEYEPSEFTFTALAGTPVQELSEALAARGQYLPFDPFLVSGGSTLAGAVASGLSGPGRFRFGGLRDFILGIRFIDGMGRLLRLGGKVVKNAAGFDLPKFFVGSLGRFGVLVELTFKVFPRPADTLTCGLQTGSLEQAVRALNEIARSRFEPDALEFRPSDNRIFVRLSGPTHALEPLARDLFARWPGQRLPDHEAALFWSELREFGWAHRDGLLIKVVLSTEHLKSFHEIIRSLPDARSHVSAAGNIGFVSLPNTSRVENLSERLSRLSLSGVTLRGEAPLWLGLRPRPQIGLAIKNALDPSGRFPGLDD